MTQIILHLSSTQRMGFRRETQKKVRYIRAFYIKSRFKGPSVSPTHLIYPAVVVPRIVPIRWSLRRGGGRGQGGVVLRDGGYRTSLNLFSNGAIPQSLPFLAVSSSCLPLV